MLYLALTQVNPAVGYVGWADRVSAENAVLVDILLEQGVSSPVLFGMILKG